MKTYFYKYNRIIRSFILFSLIVFLMQGTARTGLSSQYLAENSGKVLTAVYASRIPALPSASFFIEMQTKPDFWVSYLKETITMEEKRDTSLDETSNVVDEMTSDKKWWKKEVDSFVDFEQQTPSVKMQYDSYYWPHYLQEVVFE